MNMSNASDVSSSVSGCGIDSRRLNPMATDFTPVARTSSKRKASSSAKSVLLAPPYPAEEQVYVAQ